MFNMNYDQYPMNIREDYSDIHIVYQSHQNEEEKRIKESKEKCISLIFNIVCLTLGMGICLTIVFISTISDKILNINAILQSRNTIEKIQTNLSNTDDLFCDGIVCNELLRNNLYIYDETFSTCVVMVILFGFIIVCPIIYLIVSILCCKVKTFHFDDECSDNGCSAGNCFVAWFIIFTSIPNFIMFIKCCIIFNSYIKLKHINIIMFISAQSEITYEFKKNTYPNMISSITCFVTQLIATVLLVILFVVKIKQRYDANICSFVNIC
jgi:hypothetical protein